jgi:NAD(P)-dependent dehydrogenase (short-subunit alcohol dehydrogenase family)
MARRPANPADGCAWVTGASSGIGAALALELARRGWRVALTARSEDGLQSVAAKAPEAMLVAPADVSDAVSMRGAYETIRARFGHVGLVVSNAGIYLPVDAPKLESGAFRRTFDVNVIGAARACELVLPDFIARGRGHIHIVSSATAFGGMPTAAAYGASKAALFNLAETLKIELDPYGVGVSVSTPGFVDTPAQDENTFPRPFEISAETAARRIVEGLARGGFEITFPRRFTWLLKAIYALPPAWHIPLVRKWTGWDKRER